MQVLDEHIFLSTPSARRATEGQRTQNAVGLISIHALREEGDRALDKLSEEGDLTWTSRKLP